MPLEKVAPGKPARAVHPWQSITHDSNRISVAVKSQRLSGRINFELIKTRPRRTILVCGKHQLCDPKNRLTRRQQTPLKARALRKFEALKLQAFSRNRRRFTGGEVKLKLPGRDSRTRI